MKPEDIARAEAKKRNWLPVVVVIVFVFGVAACSCVATVLWPH